MNVVKGMRDYMPSQMKKMDYIFSVIEEVYRLYGFEKIQTPAMEGIDTLMGKYGGEGDKLIYKIESHREGVKSDKALRYDLTVPFARFVMTHREEITLPFRRYQIQPVWRADKPQRGRYREFYQCDCDVIGDDSLTGEADMISILATVFRRLRIPVIIRVNDRKLLNALCVLTGQEKRIKDITTCIDKIDKIGVEAVCELMKKKGIEMIDVIRDFLTIERSDALTRLKMLFKDIPCGLQGIEEIEEVLSYIGDDEVVIDTSLARGMDYYSGVIIEVVPSDGQMSSIAGGGRYDDLCSIFGMDDISGIGVSFGADRIYDYMESHALFPSDIGQAIDVLVLGERKEEMYAYTRELREMGLKTQMYTRDDKLSRQMRYADKIKALYVLIDDKSLVLREMSTGSQQEIEDIKDIKKYIKKI